jgi:predicted SnoaL-like aldol condensation-catalyzing enzyme
VADGAQAFIDFVNAFATQFPQFDADLKHVVAECDLVVTHSHVTTALDTAGNEPAALALFRSAGYQPIRDYNQNRYARYWFEKPL